MLYGLNTKCVLWLQTSISLFFEGTECICNLLTSTFSVTLLEYSYPFILYHIRYRKKSI